jgi:hypothetical protein
VKPGRKKQHWEGIGGLDGTGQMNNISNIEVFYQFTNKIKGLSFNLTKINGYKTVLFCFAIVQMMKYQSSIFLE